MGPYVPNGSYRQTSREIKVTLSAECQKIDGSWQLTTFDLTEIGYVELENNDGTLTVSGPASPTPGYVPGGSYQQTSRNIKVTLSAQCQKIDGSWQPSALNITNLNNADVENQNGVLVAV
jgi:hypothetical protein